MKNHTRKHMFDGKHTADNKYISDDSEVLVIKEVRRIAHVLSVLVLVLTIGLIISLGVNFILFYQTTEYQRKISEYQLMQDIDYDEFIDLLLKPEIEPSYSPGFPEATPLSAPSLFQAKEPIPQETQDSPLCVAFFNSQHYVNQQGETQVTLVRIGDDASSGGTVDLYEYSQRENNPLATIEFAEGQTEWADTLTVASHMTNLAVVDDCNNTIQEATDSNNIGYLEREPTK